MLVSKEFVQRILDEFDWEFVDNGAHKCSNTFNIKRFKEFQQIYGLEILTSIREFLYVCKHHKDDGFVDSMFCCICGKLTHYNPNTGSYKSTCNSPECIKAIRAKAISEKSKNKDWIEKRNEKSKKTCLERYGVDNAMKNPKIFLKAQKTIEEKYGVSNVSLSESIKEKRKKTFLEKYGNDSFIKTKEFKEKSKVSLEKHYGVTHPQLSEEIREKTKKTCLKKYGTEVALLNKEVNEKSKNSCKEKFGSDYALSSPLVREKIKNTCKKKYGVESSFGAEEVKKKIKNTNRERYGFENPTKSSEVRKKLSSSLRSKEVREKVFISKRKNGTFNSSIPQFKAKVLLQSVFGEKGVLEEYFDKERYPYKCDFYLPSLDKFIEFQGTWCHGFEPFVGSKEQESTIKEWKEKGGKYYLYAIKVWTEKDVEKRRLAKKNKLNWIEFFHYEEFKEWLNSYVTSRAKVFKEKIETRVLSFCEKHSIDFSKIQVVSPYLKEKPEEGKKYYLFDFEWKDKEKRKIWKSILLYGNNSLKPIGARKCSVREIKDKKLEKEFLNKNHLQGYIPSKVAIGLFFNEELVSLISLGKPRFSKVAKWEILRFCSKKEVSVQGGASKLLAFFRNTYSGSIISYANKRFSEGKLYEVLGFEKIAESKPNYWYILPVENIPYNRIKFQKYKLKDKLSIFDSSKSEALNMKDNGFFQFFDKGSITYVLK